MQDASEMCLCTISLNINYYNIIIIIIYTVNTFTVISWIHCIGSFGKELRTLFNQFKKPFFEREQDYFCRSLSSIRKYYLYLLVYNVSVSVCCLRY
jgi:hypothetical protein